MEKSKDKKAAKTATGTPDVQELRRRVEYLEKRLEQVCDFNHTLAMGFAAMQENEGGDLNPEFFKWDRPAAYDKM